MSTEFRAIEIPPGVVALATKKQRSSNWSEVNLVRWREGQLAPIGGQLQYNYTFASRCKKVHGWYGGDVNSTYYTAYLCENNLYIDTGGVLYDITPTGGMVAPGHSRMGGYGDGLYGQGEWEILGTTFSAGATTITMVDPPDWGFPAGMDVSKINLATGVATFIGKVASITGNVVTLASAAANGATAGDTINFGAYGDARPLSTFAAIDKIPNAFSLDNFGFILLAMTSPDGRLLYWDPGAGPPGPGNIAKPVVPDSGRGPVPTGRCFVVTPERFVIMFGAMDPTNGGGFRREAWCDQENFKAWDYGNLTSQAGFLDIEPSSPIVAAISTRTGVLFWTGKKTYRSRFLGLPYIYNYEELADACTPWSPQSMVNTSSMVLWFAEQGVFSYDGTSVLPVACKVRAWIDDDIDMISVREQACAVHIENFNEYWWFFPQLNQNYNTRCVYYNYKEGWWAQGQMARSAGVTSAYSSHSIMADGLIAYQHETNVTYSPDAGLPWAETFDLNLGSAKLMTVKQMMPDIEGDGTANVLYSLLYRNPRVSIGVPEQQTDPRSVRDDGYVDFRTTGRDIRLHIDLATDRTRVLDVTVGQHLIDFVPRGDR